MNCQQFTSFIVEAARGQMMDAASRDGALVHAESCQACAARLAQEQSLTGALRAVALHMKDLSAPARVEAKLLAAFQQNLAPQNVATATDATPRAPLSLASKTGAAQAAGVTHTSSRRTRRIAYAATAIAASLVLVVLASLYLRFTQTAPPSQDVAINSQPAVSLESPRERDLTVAASSPSSSPASSSPSSSPAPSIEPEQQTARRALPNINRSVENRSVAAQRATAKHARRHTPTMIEAQHVIDGGSAIIEPGEGETIASGATKPNEAESVTEFISLVADAPAGTPLESGQLVRVQVPRAALASLGLPSNIERGNEPIKADVLLGGDGLARAIRFVR
jgi:hypothetical protein